MYFILTLYCYFEKNIYKIKGMGLSSRPNYELTTDESKKVEAARNTIDLFVNSIYQ